jgi:cathepsin B
MKFAVFALLVATASAGVFEDIVEKVNSSPNITWTAGINNHATVDDVKTLCGTYTPGHPLYKPANLEPKVFSDEVLAAVPASFDARTAFANCTVIGTIRDQSACGSCWAFGSVESFEDRRCISTGEDKEFSPLDVGACSGAGNGCSGGMPTQALEWMASTGVVSGGDFSADDTGSSCQPYGFAPCAHHVPATAKYPKCPSAEYNMRCSRKCTDSKFTGTMASDRKKGTKAFSSRTVPQMQAALQSGGTLSVAFTVYADFETYKSGVYKHTTGSALGGHAVAFIGWGTESGTDYWLVKNSWNEQWGDGGTFKIVRGTNECGIENEVAGIDF